MNHFFNNHLAQCVHQSGMAVSLTYDHSNKLSPPKKIAVIYVCDENYHDLTLYSLASIALKNRSPLDFFFLQSEYSRPAPYTVSTVMQSYGHKLTVADAPQFDRGFKLNGHEGKYQHISRAMFLKAMAIEQFADRYDYILYLDGDILAFDDLNLEEMAGFPEMVAAGLDLSSATGFDDPTFFSNCARHQVSTNFFNSGVIMVNARKWRKTRAGERFAENLLRHQEFCPYFSACAPNDQCALNMTLGSDLKRLPITWNVQKSALQTKAWETAIVRHYTGAKKFLPVRPWTCDPREYRLLRTISQTCGLSAPSNFYDLGLSYALNKVRRRKTIAQYERAIAEIDPSISECFSQV